MLNKSANPRNTFAVSIWPLLICMVQNDAFSIWPLDICMVQRGAFIMQQFFYAMSNRILWLLSMQGILILKTCRNLPLPSPSVVQLWKNQNQSVYVTLCFPTASKNWNCIRKQNAPLISMLKSAMVCTNPNKLFNYTGILCWKLNFTTIWK